MFGVLFLLFLIVPIVEIYLVVQVGSSIGVLETIGLLILISVVGAWLVRREGLGILRRVQQQLAKGELPTKEVVDGLLVLFAGALMLTPGFLTDGFGVLLLIPPTRAIVRTLLIRRYRDRITVGGATRWVGGQRASGATYYGDIYDVTDITDVGDVDHTPTDPDELGP